MTFNFSKLFKTAHQIAKAIRENFASYRAAFSAALKTAWDELRGATMIGKTRQWAFDRYTALRAAQRTLWDEYQASKKSLSATRRAQLVDAYDRAQAAAKSFADELCNRCKINGRAIRNLDFWFRTTLDGRLYDAEDVIEAA